jgi:hypothetical protein
MCLNETLITVHTGKHLFAAFLIQSNLKQGNALSSLLSNFTLEQRRRIYGLQAGSSLYQHMSEWRYWCASLDLGTRW